MVMVRELVLLVVLVLDTLLPDPTHLFLLPLLLGESGMVVPVSELVMVLVSAAMAVDTAVDMVVDLEDMVEVLDTVLVASLVAMLGKPFHHSCNRATIPTEVHILICNRLITVNIH